MLQEQCYKTLKEIKKFSDVIDDIQKDVQLDNMDEEKLIKKIFTLHHSKNKFLRALVDYKSEAMEEFSRYSGNMMELSERFREIQNKFETALQQIYSKNQQQKESKQDEYELISFFNNTAFIPWDDASQRFKLHLTWRLQRIYKYDSTSLFKMTCEYPKIFTIFVDLLSDEFSMKDTVNYFLRMSPSLAKFLPTHIKNNEEFVNRTIELIKADKLSLFSKGLNKVVYQKTAVYTITKNVEYFENLSLELKTNSVLSSYKEYNKTRADYYSALSHLWNRSRLAVFEECQEYDPKAHRIFLEANYKDYEDLLLEALKLQAPFNKALEGFQKELNAISLQEFIDWNWADMVSDFLKDMSDSGFPNSVFSLLTAKNLKPDESFQKKLTSMSKLSQYYVQINNELRTLLEKKKTDEGVKKNEYITTTLFNKHFSTAPKINKPLEDLEKLLPKDEGYISPEIMEKMLGALKKVDAPELSNLKANLTSYMVEKEQYDKTVDSKQPSYTPQ